MNNLDVARKFAADIFDVTGETTLHYAAIITAFSALAMAEKMYEERGALGTEAELWIEHFKSLPGP